MTMTERSMSDETGLVPAGRSLPDDAATREWAEELVARARAEGVELSGDGGLLTGLVRQVFQTGLESNSKTISVTRLTTRLGVGAATCVTGRRARR